MSFVDLNFSMRLRFEKFFSRGTLTEIESHALISISTTFYSFSIFMLTYFKCTFIYLVRLFTIEQKPTDCLTN